MFTFASHLYTYRVLLALAIPVTLIGLSGCDRRPPLNQALAAIACPVGQQHHAVTTFVNAEVTFVCVTKEVADKPMLMRCDQNSRPVYCEDSGMIKLSRLPGGKLVTGAPSSERGYQAPLVTTPETDAGSVLEVSFYDKPPGTPNYEVGPRQYLRAPDKQRLPAGFRLVNGPVCDRVSNALHLATCKLEAKSASLHWYILVSIPRPSGNDVDDTLYDKDMALWLDLLGQMVTDPKT